MLHNQLSTHTFSEFMLSLKYGNHNHIAKHGNITLPTTMNSEAWRIQKRFKDVIASRTFRNIAETLGLKEKRVLDLGCGYGEYMQRFGKDSVGITTTPAEVAYGESHHIDLRAGNVELLHQTIASTENFDAFWANNLFEHLLSPHAFLVHLKQFAKDDTLLILGVPMVPKIEPLMKIKKFRGSLASPHINFFTKKTFQLTIERAGWDVIDNRSFFLPVPALDRIISPLMPHLYIVAKNNPHYTYPPKKVKEWEDDGHYADLLKIMK